MKTIKLNPFVLTDMSKLPDRVQGKGYRADDYYRLPKNTEIAILNDEEFNKVVSHNINGEGENYNVLSIINGRAHFLIIRQNALLDMTNESDLKPSLFTDNPIDSILQNYQSEIIAKNIMIILKRTGNVFRELTWEEYQTERMKDTDFNAGERYYFDKVSYLSKGDKSQLLAFSPVWKKSYMRLLEMIQGDEDWIPVETSNPPAVKNAPEISRHVLVANAETTQVAYYEYGTKNWIAAHDTKYTILKGVTHYRLLPARPKGY